MNIYYISIHKDRLGTMFDIYYGLADTIDEAIKKAIAKAKEEGCENPIVSMVKCEGKRAF